MIFHISILFLFKNTLLDLNMPVVNDRRSTYISDRGLLSSIKKHKNKKKRNEFDWINIF